MVWLKYEIIFLVMILAVNSDSIRDDRSRKKPRRHSGNVRMHSRNPSLLTTTPANDWNSATSRRSENDEGRISKKTRTLLRSQGQDVATPNKKATSSSVTTTNTTTPFPFPEGSVKVRALSIQYLSRTLPKRLIPMMVSPPSATEHYGRPREHTLVPKTSMRNGTRTRYERLHSPSEKKPEVRKSHHFNVNEMTRISTRIPATNEMKPKHSEKRRGERRQDITNWKRRAVAKKMPTPALTVKSSVKHSGAHAVRTTFKSKHGPHQTTTLTSSENTMKDHITTRHGIEPKIKDSDEQYDGKSRTNQRDHRTLLIETRCEGDNMATTAHGGRSVSAKTPSHPSVSCRRHVSKHSQGSVNTSQRKQIEIATIHSPTLTSTMFTPSRKTAEYPVTRSNHQTKSGSFKIEKKKDNVASSHSSHTSTERTHGIKSRMNKVNDHGELRPVNKKEHNGTIRKVQNIHTRNSKMNLNTTGRSLHGTRVNVKKKEDKVEVSVNSTNKTCLCTCYHSKNGMLLNKVKHPPKSSVHEGRRLKNDLERKHEGSLKSHSRNIIASNAQRQTYSPNVATRHSRVHDSVDHQSEDTSVRKKSSQTSYGVRTRSSNQERNIRKHSTQISSPHTRTQTLSQNKHHLVQSQNVQERKLLPRRRQGHESTYRSNMKTSESRSLERTKQTVQDQNRVKPVSIRRVNKRSIISDAAPFGGLDLLQSQLLENWKGNGWSPSVPFDPGMVINSQEFIPHQIVAKINVPHLKVIQATRPNRVNENANVMEHKKRIHILTTVQPVGTTPLKPSNKDTVRDLPLVVDLLTKLGESGQATKQPLENSVTSSQVETTTSPVSVTSVSENQLETENKTDNLSHVSNYSFPQEISTLPQMIENETDGFVSKNFHEDLSSKSDVNNKNTKSNITMSVDVANVRADTPSDQLDVLETPPTPLSVKPDVSYLTTSNVLRAKHKPNEIDTKNVTDLLDISKDNLRILSLSNVLDNGDVSRETHQSTFTNISNENQVNIIESNYKGNEIELEKANVEFSYSNPHNGINDEYGVEINKNASKIQSNEHFNGYSDNDEPGHEIDSFEEEMNDKTSDMEFNQEYDEVSTMGAPIDENHFLEINDGNQVITNDAPVDVAPDDVITENNDELENLHTETIPKENKTRPHILPVEDEEGKVDLDNTYYSEDNDTLDEEDYDEFPIDDDGGDDTEEYPDDDSFYTERNIESNSESDAISRVGETYENSDVNHPVYPSGNYEPENEDTDMSAIDLDGSDTDESKTLHLENTNQTSKNPDGLLPMNQNGRILDDSKTIHPQMTVYSQMETADMSSVDDTDKNIHSYEVIYPGAINDLDRAKIGMLSPVGGNGNNTYEYENIFLERTTKPLRSSDEILTQHLISKNFDNSETAHPQMTVESQMKTIDELHVDDTDKTIDDASQMFYPGAIDDQAKEEMYISPIGGNDNNTENSENIFLGGIIKPREFSHEMLPKVFDVNETIPPQMTVESQMKRADVLFVDDTDKNIDDRFQMFYPGAIADLGNKEIGIHPMGSNSNNAEESEHIFLGGIIKPNKNSDEILPIDREGKTFDDNETIPPQETVESQMKRDDMYFVDDTDKNIDSSQVFYPGGIDDLEKEEIGISPKSGNSEESEKIFLGEIIKPHDNSEEMLPFDRGGKTFDENETISPQRTEESQMKRDDMYFVDDTDENVDSSQVFYPGGIDDLEKEEIGISSKSGNSEESEKIFLGEIIKPHDNSEEMLPFDRGGKTFDENETIPPQRTEESQMKRDDMYFVDDTDENVDSSQVFYPGGIDDLGKEEIGMSPIGVNGNNTEESENIFLGRIIKPLENVDEHFPMDDMIYPERTVDSHKDTGGVRNNNDTDKNIEDTPTFYPGVFDVLGKKENSMSPIGDDSNNTKETENIFLERLIKPQENSHGMLPIYPEMIIEQNNEPYYGILSVDNTKKNIDKTINTFHSEDADALDEEKISTSRFYDTEETDMIHRDSLTNPSEKLYGTLSASVNNTNLDSSEWIYPRNIIQPTNERNENFKNHATENNVEDFVSIDREGTQVSGTKPYHTLPINLHGENVESLDKYNAGESTGGPIKNPNSTLHFRRPHDNAEDLERYYSESTREANKAPNELLVLPNHSRVLPIEKIYKETSIKPIETSTDYPPTDSTGDVIPTGEINNLSSIEHQHETINILTNEGYTQELNTNYARTPNADQRFFVPLGISSEGRVNTNTFTSEYDDFHPHSEQNNNVTLATDITNTLTKEAEHIDQRSTVEPSNSSTFELPIDRKNKRRNINKNARVNQSNTSVDSAGSLHVEGFDKTINNIVQTITNGTVKQKHFMAIEPLNEVDINISSIFAPNVESTQSNDDFTTLRSVKTGAKKGTASKNGSDTLSIQEASKDINRLAIETLTPTRFTVNRDRTGNNGGRMFTRAKIRKPTRFNHERDGISYRSQEIVKDDDIPINQTNVSVTQIGNNLTGIHKRKKVTRKKISKPKLSNQNVEDRLNNNINEMKYVNKESNNTTLKYEKHRNFPNAKEGITVKDVTASDKIILMKPNVKIDGKFRNAMEEKHIDGMAKNQPDVKETLSSGIEKHDIEGLIKIKQADESTFPGHKEESKSIDGINQHNNQDRNKNQHVHDSFVIDAEGRTSDDIWKHSKGGLIQSKHHHEDTLLRDGNGEIIELTGKHNITEGIYVSTEKDDVTYFDSVGEKDTVVYIHSKNLSDIVPFNYVEGEILTDLVQNETNNGITRKQPLTMGYSLNMYKETSANTFNLNKTKNVKAPHHDQAIFVSSGTGMRGEIFNATRMKGTYHEKPKDDKHYFFQNITNSNIGNKTENISMSSYEHFGIFLNDVDNIDDKHTGSFITPIHGDGIFLGDIGSKNAEDMRTPNSDNMFTKRTGEYRSSQLSGNNMEHNNDRHAKTIQEDDNTNKSKSSLIIPIEVDTGDSSEYINIRSVGNTAILSVVVNNLATYNFVLQRPGSETENISELLNNGDASHSSVKMPVKLGTKDSKSYLNVSFVEDVPTLSVVINNTLTDQFPIGGFDRPANDVSEVKDATFGDTTPKEDIHTVNQFDSNDDNSQKDDINLEKTNITGSEVDYVQSLEGVADEAPEKVQSKYWRNYQREQMHSGHPPGKLEKIRKHTPFAEESNSKSSPYTLPVTTNVETTHVLQSSRKIEQPVFKYKKLSDDVYQAVLERKLAVDNPITLPPKPLSIIEDQTMHAPTFSGKVHHIGLKKELADKTPTVLPPKAFSYIEYETSHKSNADKIELIGKTSEEAQKTLTSTSLPTNEDGAMHNLTYSGKVDEITFKGMPVDEVRLRLRPKHLPVRKQEERNSSTNSRRLDKINVHRRPVDRARRKMHPESKSLPSTEHAATHIEKTNNTELKLKHTDQDPPKYLPTTGQVTTHDGTYSAKVEQVGFKGKPLHDARNRLRPKTLPVTVHKPTHMREADEVKIKRKPTDEAMTTLSPQPVTTTEQQRAHKWEAEYVEVNGKSADEKADVMPLKTLPTFEPEIAHRWEADKIELYGKPAEEAPNTLPRKYVPTTEHEMSHTWDKDRMELNGKSDDELPTKSLPSIEHHVSNKWEAQKIELNGKAAEGEVSSLSRKSLRTTEYELTNAWDAEKMYLNVKINDEAPSTLAPEYITTTELNNAHTKQAKQIELNLKPADEVSSTLPPKYLYSTDHENAHVWEEHTIELYGKPAVEVPTTLPPNSRRFTEYELTDIGEADQKELNENQTVKVSSGLLPKLLPYTEYEIKNLSTRSEEIDQVGLQRVSTEEALSTLRPKSLLATEREATHGSKGKVVKVAPRRKTKHKARRRKHPKTLPVHVQKTTQSAVADQIELKTIPADEVPSTLFPKAIPNTENEIMNRLRDSDSLEEVGLVRNPSEEAPSTLAPKLFPSAEYDVSYRPKYSDKLEEGRFQRNPSEEARSTLAPKSFQSAKHEIPYGPMYLDKLEEGWLLRNPSNKAPSTLAPKLFPSAEYDVSYEPKYSDKLEEERIQRNPSEEARSTLAPELFPSAEYDIKYGPQYSDKIEEGRLHRNPSEEAPSILAPKPFQSAEYDIMYGPQYSDKLEERRLQRNPFEEGFSTFAPKLFQSAEYDVSYRPKYSDKLEEIRLHRNPSEEASSMLAPKPFQSAEYDVMYGPQYSDKLEERRLHRNPSEEASSTLALKPFQSAEYDVMYEPRYLDKLEERRLQRNLSAKHDIPYGLNYSDKLEKGQLQRNRSEEAPRSLALKPFQSAEYDVMYGPQYLDKLEERRLQRNPSAKHDIPYGLNYSDKLEGGQLQRNRSEEAPRSLAPKLFPSAEYDIPYGPKYPDKLEEGRLQRNPFEEASSTLAPKLFPSAEYDIPYGPKYLDKLEEVQLQRNPSEDAPSTMAPKLFTSAEYDITYGSKYSHASKEAEFTRNSTKELPSTFVSKSVDATSHDTTYGQTPLNETNRTDEAAIMVVPKSVTNTEHELPYGSTNSGQRESVGLKRKSVHKTRRKKRPKTITIMVQETMHTGETDQRNQNGTPFDREQRALPPKGVSNTEHEILYRSPYSEKFEEVGSERNPAHEALSTLAPKPLPGIKHETIHESTYFVTNKEVGFAMNQAHEALSTLAPKTLPNTKYELAHGSTYSGNVQEIGLERNPAEEVPSTLASKSVPVNKHETSYESIYSGKVEQAGLEKGRAENTSSTLASKPQPTSDHKIINVSSTYSEEMEQIGSKKKSSQNVQSRMRPKTSTITSPIYVQEKTHGGKENELKVKPSNEAPSSLPPKTLPNTNQKTTQGSSYSGKEVREGFKRKPNHNSRRRSRRPKTSPIIFHETTHTVKEDKWRPADETPSTLPSKVLPNIKEDNIVNIPMYSETVDRVGLKKILMQNTRKSMIPEHLATTGHEMIHGSTYSGGEQIGSMITPTDEASNRLPSKPFPINRYVTTRGYGYSWIEEPKYNFEMENKQVDENISRNKFPRPTVMKDEEGIVHTMERMDDVKYRDLHSLDSTAKVERKENVKIEKKQVDENISDEKFPRFTLVKEDNYGVVPTKDRTDDVKNHGVYGFVYPEDVERKENFESEKKQVDEILLSIKLPHLNNGIKEGERAIIPKKEITDSVNDHGLHVLVYSGNADRNENSDTEKKNVGEHISNKNFPRTEITQREKEDGIVPTEKIADAANNHSLFNHSLVYSQNIYRKQNFESGNKQADGNISNEKLSRVAMIKESEIAPAKEGTDHRTTGNDDDVYYHAFFSYAYNPHSTGAPESGRQKTNENKHSDVVYEAAESVQEKVVSPL